jgi:hypothetical protein
VAGIATAGVGPTTVANGGTGATSFTGGFVKSPGGTGILTSSATVNAATELSGVVSLTNGGTGATSAATALTSLGAYPASNPNGFTSNTGTVTSVGASVPSFLSLSGSPITTSGTLAISYSGTALPVANGGTGQNTLPANAVLIGNGTSGITSVSPGALGQVLTSNGVSWISQAPTTSGGTVTSVAFSTGSTGLTVTGSPITSSGTISLAGTLNVLNGGTGATSLTGILRGNGTGAFSVASGLDITNAIGLNAVTNATNAGNVPYTGLTGAVPIWNQNTTGNAATVTNGVYTVGNQTIDGVKTFSSTITGSISGNAGSVTDGVYLSTTQTFTGAKTFTGSISSQAYNFNANTSIFYTLGSNDLQMFIGGNQVFKSSSNGDLTINGSNATKASGTAWINPSDRRLKDNIVNYTKGLAELAQVVPKTFEFNGKAGSTAGLKAIGIIADEIEQVLPKTVTKYMVKLNPEDAQETEVKYFDSSELTWVMVNAIKELKAEVDSLKAQLAAK